MILTKEFTFDCAHSLLNYDGKCSNIHGHTYRLKIFIKGIPIVDDTKNIGGMIYDFYEIKKIVSTYLLDKYDHSIITTKKEFYYKELFSKTKFMCLEYPFNVKTTCEMISLQMINDLSKMKIPIYALELWETATSSCYVTIEDLYEYINKY